MKIEHVAFWVQDLEGLRRFYEKYFHGKAGERYHNPNKNFHSYFISFHTGCRLELMSMPGIESLDKSSQFLGITHLAFSVGSAAQVDALTEQLRTDGYIVAGEPRTTGDGYYESVILDPEGNRIEISV